MRRSAGIIGVLAALWPGSMAAQPLSVLYGPEAPAREGDVDHVEQIFFSVPADLGDRLYLRVLDPEAAGEHDTPFGAAADSVTLYRFIGGPGAFSAAPAPGAADAASDPIAERRFGADAGTDGVAVPIAAFTAADGEVIDGQAYFRVEAIGEAGDDGNAFAIAVSTSPGRDAPPPGLRMFGYLPTVRWPEDAPPTELRFSAPEGAALTLRNYDAAGAEIGLASTYDEARLAASDQDAWAEAGFRVPEGATAITLRGGAETPNDLTLGLVDADGRPVALELPARPVAPAPRPVPAASARPLADCRSVAFDASGSRGSGALAYRWDFGDGATSEAPTIVHRYAAPGAYQATLRVVEEGDRVASGAIARAPVLVRPAPVAVAGEPATVAPGEPVRFDGTASRPSDRPIQSFAWTFGDGTTAEGAAAEKAFAAPGHYRVVLRVEDGADHPCNFGTATRLVTVNAAPVAVAGEDRTAAVGETVTLSGAASYDIDGAIASFQWDLGDGTRAEGATVSHVFATPGIHEATLTVRDASGVGNAATSDRVAIRVNAPPEPQATGPARPIAVGEVARLDGAASRDPDGAILSYAWDFGDGATGSGPAVDYAWTAPGVYPVRLTVTDDSATPSATTSTELEVVVSAAPVADPGPDQHVTASVVEFDGGGSADPDGRITSWAWDFGDGATGFGRVVRHAYAEPGRYGVALTVRDDSGAPLNLARATATLTINAAPIADAGPDLIGAPGQELTLDASGSVDPDGEIAEYRWTLPGGEELRGRRALWAPDTPGLHRVRLAVRDDSGHEAAFDVDEVLVTINAGPVADAGPDVLAEPGVSVRLSGSNSFDPDGEVATWRWDFDDLDAPVFGPVAERTFERPGAYAAQLTVIDDSGTANASATDEVRLRINHPPVAEAGPDVATGSLFVALDGSGSTDADGDPLIYSWSFGDGSAPALGRQVTHAYRRSGVFPVSLSVDDGTGLGNATAVDSLRVAINAAPVAVAGGNRDVCVGDTVLFDGSGSVDPDGGLLRYTWDFGDRTGSELVNPAKTYDRPGVYPLSLTVRDESGAATGSHTDRASVLVRQAPTADAGPPILACTNQTVRFDGSGSTDADGAVDLFQWNFGDGSTGGGERPSKVYERPGEYSVVLTITGDALGSCSAVHSDETRVTVIEAPRLEIVGPARVAVGEETRYRADLSGTEDGARFTWSFGEAATLEGREVAHVFDAAGLHPVTLSAELPRRDDGCNHVETRLNVIANAAPVPAIDAPERIAAGALVLFDATASTDPDGALTAFDWDFGDGAAATGVQVRHRYVQPGEYLLRLAVTDDAGVANSRATETRRVTVSPGPEVALADPGPLCPGAPHLWSAPAEDGVTAAWDFGGVDKGTAEKIEYVFDEPGVFPVSVTLDDGGGLANSHRVEQVFVRVNSPPVAAAGPDRLICPGDSVVFDASGSRDRDGAITAWRWDFDDGVTLGGEQVERAFGLPGTYRATLTVTDDSGSSCAMGTATAEVRVNAAPVVDAGPARDLPVGAAHDVATFDASGALDPDGDGLMLRWDFGDGTGASGTVVRHGYAEPGDYQVRVEARDATGLACGVAEDTALVRARARE